MEGLCYKPGISKFLQRFSKKRTISGQTSYLPDWLGNSTVLCPKYGFKQGKLTLC